jgi:hypothetical protein
MEGYGSNQSPQKKRPGQPERHIVELILALGTERGESVPELKEASIQHDLGYQTCRTLRALDV